MAHQYIPNIVHEPNKKPSAPHATYLMYGP